MAHPEAKEPSRAPRRRPTATSNFGAGRRESHDATAFYERFEAPTLSGDDAVEAPSAVVEPFVHGDARHMDTIIDGSVALVVTSPPYFAGKQYEEELERDGIPSSYVEYLQLLTDVFAECARKLEPGGRIAVNVANLGRKPYRSLAADVVHILQDQLQLLLRGEVVWRKGEGAAGSCAWGSFRSAANPVLRDTTERVVIASKGRFDRALSRADRERRGLPSVNTIDADEFMAATLDVWDIEPESARRVSHPAPFPVGLPGRLIDLYTYENDLVLDPFMGSGSTLVAAARRGRRYVGYDLDPTYVDIARLRVRDEGGVTAPEPAAERAPSETVDEADNFQARATKEGKAAQALAEELLVDTGFKIVAKNKRLPGTGVTINFIATDADEVEWYFDVSGALHEHTRRPPPHRHRLEDARARARAARRAVAGAARVPHLTPAAQGQRRVTSPSRTSPSRADSSTRSRCVRPTGTSGCASTRKAGTRRFRSPASSPSGRPQDRHHRGGHRPRDVRRRRHRRGPHLPARRRCRTSATTIGDRLREAWSAGTHRDLFVASWMNGQAFLRAQDALRGRPPLVVEWRGPHRSVGDEAVPADLRVDHVYLVSCKYLSPHRRERVARAPLRPGAQRRSRAAQRRTTGSTRSRRRNTRRCTRNVRDASTTALPADVTALNAEQRRELAHSFERGSAWPGDGDALYAALVERVADESARRWRAAIDSKAESMLWRLLRIGSAPYFVLGASPKGFTRFRIATPWDWRQHFELREVRRRGPHRRAADGRVGRDRSAARRRH